MGDGDFPNGTVKLGEWVIKMEEIERRMEPFTTEKEEEEVSERNRRERLRNFYKSEIFTRGDELVTPERVSMRGRSLSREEQEMKEASLLHFINRSGRTRIHLWTYLHVLNEMFDELKVAWEELGYPWEFDDRMHFVQMMLLNGAFLLEFMRTKRDYFRTSGSLNPIIRRILEDHDETKRYQRDFLLMGSQLPLMLLDTLIMVENQRTPFLRDIKKELIAKKSTHQLLKLFNFFS